MNIVSLLSEWQFCEEVEAYWDVQQDAPEEKLGRDAKVAAQRTHNVDQAEAQGKPKNGPALRALTKWRHDIEESNLKDTEAKPRQCVCNEDTADPLDVQHENKDGGNQDAQEHKDHRHISTSQRGQPEENDTVANIPNKLANVGETRKLCEQVSSLTFLANAKGCLETILQRANCRCIAQHHGKHHKNNAADRCFFFFSCGSLAILAVLGCCIKVVLFRLHRSHTYSFKGAAA
mmetsp:Transcript_68440/g.135238  ORF Transcript_68440/g.135238 Transcript_68440/m.135238 type:complete len:233 (-) Transcript_68440:13-711(-)